MWIDKAAEALGRGYVKSREGGSEWHRVPVARGEDGAWTRPHPTDPKGADIALRNERVYAWTEAELAEQAQRWAEHERALAAEMSS